MRGQLAKENVLGSRLANQIQNGVVLHAVIPRIGHHAGRVPVVYAAGHALPQRRFYLGGFGQPFARPFRCKWPLPENLRARLAHGCASLSVGSDMNRSSDSSTLLLTFSAVISTRALISSPILLNDGPTCQRRSPITRKRSCRRSAR